MKTLESLTSEITEQLEAREKWLLSRDQVLELLGTEIQEVYGLIVGSTDPLVSFRTVKYSSLEPGVLVSVLEALGYSDAAAAFWKAGIWIPYEIQIELQEVLLGKIVSNRNSHRIDFDTFLVIFDHYSEFIRALKVYTEEFFSEEKTIDSAVEIVLKSHPETVVLTAGILLRSLARELIRREIIPFWNLHAPVFSQLKSFLVKMDRLAGPEEAESNSGRKGKTISGRGGGINAHARKIFDYALKDRIEMGELRKRYKEQMKKYHPDLNPRGLERTKEINQAYAYLLPLASVQPVTVRF